MQNRSPDDPYYNNVGARKSGTTKVVTTSDISPAYICTQSHATVTDDSLTIYDGGWQSVTTKSRLNALCNAFCVAGEGVFQKNFEWFVHRFVGESAITGKVYNVDTFTNGYVFA